MNKELKVHVVPVLKDNYTFIIHDSENSNCVVIDPGDAKTVRDYVNKHQLCLKEIWITHHHSDHQGGAKELKSMFNASIVGPKNERDKILNIDHEVADMDMFSFEGHPYKILDFPGHTLGHIGFWFFDDKCLFSGDTLFSLGCGYLFEGSYDQMWSSLCKIRSLPEDTLIYCGHEYTLENAKFALSMEPENEILKKYADSVQHLRAKNKPTIPVILKNEMYINPFLRADLPFWKKKFHMEDEPSVKVFQNLREQKNKFKD